MLLPRSIDAEELSVGGDGDGDGDVNDNDNDNASKDHDTDECHVVAQACQG